jgi:hypothetical protein
MLMDTNSSKPPRVQEIKVKGSQLLDRVKAIIEEGNARRVTIMKDGRTLMEFPLSVGLGGTAAALALAPTLAAVGAVAALVTDVKVIVERTPTAPSDLPTRAKEDPTS